MRSHESLLDALRKAIEEDNEDLVRNLFIILKSNNEDILCTSDTNKQNLLHIAMGTSKKNQNITLYLLEEIYKIRPKVIFKSDYNKRSLVWYAAESGFTTVLKQLIAYAREHGKEDWLMESDSEHNTPLHVAKSWVIKKLLNTFRDKPNRTEIINLVNKEGWTPLYVMYNRLYQSRLQNQKIDYTYFHKSIAEMINLDADLFMPRNDGEIPLTIHFLLSTEDQKAIFFKILPDKIYGVNDKTAIEKMKEKEKGKEKVADNNLITVRNIILTHCKNFIDGNPDKINASRFYTSTIASKSLLKFLQVKISNPTFPERKTMTLPKWNKPLGASPMVTFDVQDSMYTDILRELIPAYMKRIDPDLADIKIITKKIDNDNVSEDPLAQDRVEYNIFTQKFNNTSQLLNTLESPPNYACKLLGATFILLAFYLGFSGSYAAGLTYEDAQREADQAKDEYHDGTISYREKENALGFAALMMLAVIGTSLASVLGIAVAMLIGICLMAKEGKLSHHYWGKRTAMLEELVTQLESLEADKSPYTQITSALRSHLNNLKKDLFLKDLKTEIGGVCKEVKKLQFSSNMTGRPVFFRPRRKEEFDIESQENKGNAERVPLLTYPKF